MAKVIIVFSGKRKSGKDYITLKIKETLGANVCALMRLSGPLKGQYAIEHGLNSERLLDSSEYKEKYRVDMIRWGEEKRNKDPGFFCRVATLEHEEREKPVWVITDARRKTDIAYFKDTYKAGQVILVRVTASEGIRMSRGWQFVTNVDDAPSECDLDSGVKFDVILPNDGNDSETSDAISCLVNTIQGKI